MEPVLGADPRTAGSHIRTRCPMSARERFRGLALGAAAWSSAAAACAAASVPSALGPTLFPTCGGLAILPTGSPLPPPSGSLATFRAAVTGLRVGGSKELLASLEQTRSLIEADEPLDGRQKCGNLDLGPRKLRTSDGQASDAESLLLRSEAPLLVSSALVAVPTLQRRPDQPRVQAARPGTTSTKLTDYGLIPPGRNS